MTENRKPAYDLKRIQIVFDCEDNLNVTVTARHTALDLGFDAQRIVEVIQTIKRTHFYKSMTSTYDHKVWQDVYHVPSEKGLLYVKFAADAVTEFALLSFKEK